MKETHEYLVPDYYMSFSCKMGACRTPCCEGWPISLSMRDYFHLLGVECSPGLRIKLDCAMHMLEHPTEEEYARIYPRYDGHCPMHMDDGRCAIHAELGDESLSYVCRLYPRGVRSEGDYECSCANSCEAVLEQLLNRRDPIRFESRKLTFDLPEATGRTVFFETVGREQEIRLYFIRKIQQRELAMPLRIMSLGKSLQAMEEALNHCDARRVDMLLKDAPVETPKGVHEIDHAHLAFGLCAAEGMLELLDKQSDSIREYGEFSLEYFGGGEDALEKYRRARMHFDRCFPEWEVWCEHILVNHMFFSRFPFQDRPESMYDEFIAICAVYALLRFLSLGWMHDKGDVESLVDVTGAAFRLIDHTSFDRTAAHLLKKLQCDTPEKLFDLIAL